MIKEDEKQQELAVSAKFLIKENEIEISGSEDFVNKQIESFKDTIMLRLETIPSKAPQTTNVIPGKKIFQIPSDTSDAETIEYVMKNDTQGQVDFDNVYAVNGDQVSVIADVPGNNTSQKMLNLILIYMWAKLQQGIEEVPFKELRDMCEKYGEVDKPNFSKIMNSQKKLFLVTGESKNQNARLVRPGIKAAEKLVHDLNAQA